MALPKNLSESKHLYIALVKIKIQLWKVNFGPAQNYLKGFWQKFWDCAQFLLARHLMYKKYNRIFKFSYVESFYQHMYKVDGNFFF